jgi:hypothetical protein
MNLRLQDKGTIRLTICLLQAWRYLVQNAYSMHMAA